MDHLFKQLIGGALRFPGLTLAVGLAIFVVGVFTTRHIPVDVFPDFAPLQVEIQTEAPGYAPEEVENLITLQLESQLVSVPHVETVRSISTTGLSVITLIFEDNTDLLNARQWTAERLQQVRQRLPQGIDDPVMMPTTNAVSHVIRVGLVPDIAKGTTLSQLSPQERHALTELRTLVDWTWKPRLLAENGVAQVVVHGGLEKTLDVLVQPEVLKDYHLSWQDVIKAAGGGNTVGNGGFIRQSNREWLVRGLGRVESSQDLSQSLVTFRGQTPIPLGQVAQVQEGHQPLIGEAFVNGVPAILLNITKLPEANTLDVTHQLETAIAELKPTLPQSTSMVTVFRQADFIEVAVHNVLEAILLGGFLVAVVLFLFLNQWRTTLISLMAIPLSLLMAVLALDALGMSINTMTLGGLAIAIGEVVDDAIIDVENVYRRLRENVARAFPRPVLTVILEASQEIRTSVVYATGIIALVLLPVMALGGLEGRIFQPLGWAFLLAMGASLLVALTLTPAMCLALLGRCKTLPHQEPLLVHALKEWYGRALHVVLKFPGLAIGAAVILFLVSLLPLTWLGQSFLPEFDEQNLVVVLQTEPGTSLETTSHMGAVLTKHLDSHDEVLAVGQRAGRAQGSDDFGSSDFSEFDIRLTHGGATRDDLREHLRQDFVQIPGVLVNFGSYISHRMDHVLTGVYAPIVVKVYGPDLETLHHLAQAIGAAMKTVTTARDVQVEPIIPIPQVAITIDRQAAAQYGLTTAHINGVIEAAFRGTAVSQWIQGQQVFDVRVWLDPLLRQSPDSVGQVMIQTPRGGAIPLSSVATITQSTTPNTIQHEDRSRRVVIQAHPRIDDLSQVVADLEAAITAQVPMPEGYYWQMGGEHTAQTQASQRLITLTVMVLIIMAGLLVMVFRSIPAALAVMAMLPLAWIGGIWFTAWFSGIMSVGTLVGFITLLGIATRNGILMVQQFRALAVAHPERDWTDILIEGAQSRMSPVLMTALTAGLGVAPIAILGGAGRELEQPLAWVILGGMLTATPLTLFVLPALFQWVGPDILGEGVETHSTEPQEGANP